MSRTLHDLVLGELQQLTTKSQRDDRFDTYMKKTYNKTASLMANSCQAVAQMASTASNTGLALNKILGKNLPNWCGSSSNNTLFETENEWQKTEPVPIPLPRASRAFSKQNLAPVHLLTKMDKWNYL